MIRAIVRQSVRTAILLLTGALVVALVYLAMYSAEPPVPRNLRPEVKRIMFRSRRRRPLGPEPRRVVSVVGETGLFWMLAYGGRRFLRLRL
ncbi:MAG TPA: hypothetical protein VG273_28870 [Bryobacteraceae bacterium]|jgi:hypothetical protein|nr:hypothetical protein [Bryobacteraceae bacterium]